MSQVVTASPQPIICSTCLDPITEEVGIQFECVHKICTVCFESWKKAKAPEPCTCPECRALPQGYVPFMHNVRERELRAELMSEIQAVRGTPRNIGHIAALRLEANAHRIYQSSIEVDRPFHPEDLEDEDVLWVRMIPNERPSLLRRLVTVLAALI